MRTGLVRLLTLHAASSLQYGLLNGRHVMTHETARRQGICTAIIVCLMASQAGMIIYFGMLLS